MAEIRDSQIVVIDAAENTGANVQDSQIVVIDAAVNANANAQISQIIVIVATPANYPGNPFAMMTGM